MVAHHMWNQGGTVGGPIHGTRTAHLKARPTGPAAAIEFSPSQEGALPGAACQGADPDLWFPLDDNEIADTAGDDPQTLAKLTAEREFAERRAKAICNGCPVQIQCLMGALERREEFGIFGGMTAAERHSVARRAYRAAAAARTGAAG